MPGVKALGMDVYYLMDASADESCSVRHLKEKQSEFIDNNCIVQREISWAEHGAF